MSESVQDSKKTKNDPEPSILSDEESFVVLDSSLSNEQGGSYTYCNSHCSGVPTVPSSSRPVNPPCTSQTSGSVWSPDEKTLLEGKVSVDSQALSLFSMDLSPEEIQVKLGQVLQENLDLKETLNQNNLAMKQQLTTLRAWQDQVAKSHLNHKEKFAETKDLILRLRTENEELKNVVKELENKAAPLPVTIGSEDELLSANTALTIQVNALQKQITSLGTRNETSSRKEQELISLTEQLNRQLETAERSRRQLIVDNERLQVQKTRVERDVVILKVELESQKQRGEALVKEANDLKTAVPVEQQADLEELAALRMQVQKQQEVVEQLTRQQSAPVTPANPANQMNQLQLLEQRLAEGSEDVKKQQERFSSLSSWLQVASENVNKFEGSDVDHSELVKTLYAEINFIKQALTDEQAQSQEKGKLLTEAQVKFQNLLSDYQSVLQDLEDLNKQPNQSVLERQSLTYYEVQVRGFVEKIDNMTGKIMNLTESLAEKVEKIAELNEKIQRLEAENETISVLQIQMQVYQADFNAEREARERLAGEKERLAEDLRHLQRRNQQLLNELKAAQQMYTLNIVPNGWNTISTPGRNHPRENTPPSPGPDEF